MTAEERQELVAELRDKWRTDIAAEKALRKEALETHRADIYTELEKLTAVWTAAQNAAIVATVKTYMTAIMDTIEGAAGWAARGTIIKIKIELQRRGLL